MRGGLEEQMNVQRDMVAKLKTMPIAINQPEANDQHYEVSARADGRTGGQAGGRASGRTGKWRSARRIQPTTNACHRRQVPTEFYRGCLGPWFKYSSGLWPNKDTTFEESEVAMLESYAQKAGLRDGMKIADLGCGWGSVRWAEH